jgi:hypothetical protein
MNNIICDDIVDAICKCIEKDEYHKYKYYKNLEQNYYTIRNLLECEKYAELKTKFKKNNININLKNKQLYFKAVNNYSFNIYYNKHNGNISVSL